MGILNVYCVDWCPDCRRTVNYLEKNKISYNYINIEELPPLEKKIVVDANDGNDWVTPTFEKDGKWLPFKHIESFQLPKIMKDLGIE